MENVELHPSYYCFDTIHPPRRCYRKTRRSPQTRLESHSPQIRIRVKGGEQAASAEDSVFTRRLRRRWMIQRMRGCTTGRMQQLPTSSKHLTGGGFRSPVSSLGFKVSQNSRLGGGYISEVAEGIPDGLVNHRGESTSLRQ